MKDNVLITGGLGYVGGRAGQKLSESGICNVLLGTRRLDCETPRWLDKAVITRMDLLSEDSLSEACKNVRYIIHLAALNETECEDDPEEAVRVNTLGTLKLLKAAERAGVERFIYMSTAHIYKSPLIGTITEDTLPRPLHPYAVTHKAAEDFVFASHDRKRLIGIVVRLSNGFGVPAHKDVNCWTLLANDLCRQAATTGKLVLKSAGLQRRDFITLTDVGRAVQHLLVIPPSQIGNGLFNLGGELSKTIFEFAEFVAGRCHGILGFTPPIMRPESKPGECAWPLDYRIDKLRATGFSLEKPSEKEIDDTLQQCKEWFSISKLDLHHTGTLIHGD